MNKQEIIDWAKETIETVKEDFDIRDNEFYDPGENIHEQLNKALTRERYLGYITALRLIILVLENEAE